ncbi:MAG TPA: ABC transporter ATP-binding protein [Bacteroidia bacterium]|nr:ABC transporter ATP-binding protein [Bacteroidia bacterium]
MIRAENLHKSYGQLHVLKGVNLEIKKGEVVSIVGASGAGKSTLLQLLGTLDKSEQGNIEINGTNINRLRGTELARFRNRHLGFVFQFHHLLPEFTALENICIPAFIAGMNKSDAEKRAEELLAYMGLRERGHHKPSELSGGEQQRIAVARALMNKPDVVMADEPSGNLDSKSAGELHKLFFDLRNQFGQTFVIVTHNETLADSADRKLVMKDGVIV